MKQMKAKNKLNFLINAYRNIINTELMCAEAQIMFYPSKMMCKISTLWPTSSKSYAKNAKVFAGVSKIGYDLKETQKKPKISTELMNPSFKLSYNENK